MELLTPDKAQKIKLNLNLNKKISIKQIIDN